MSAAPRQHRNCYPRSPRETLRVSIVLQVKRRALALAGRTGLLAALSIGLPAKVAAQGGSGRPIVLVITAYDELSAVVPDARLTLFSVEGVALASARSDAFGRWAIRLT